MMNSYRASMSESSVLTTEYIRPLRSSPPEFPTQEVTLRAPLLLRPVSSGVSKIPALLGMCAMLGFFVVMWLSRSGLSQSPITLMFPVMMAISMLTLLAHNSGLFQYAELDTQRRRYLNYCDRVSAELSNSVIQQYQSMMWVHPCASQLWTIIGSPRMWERRITDSDFVHIRLGLANQRLCRPIILPAMAARTDVDPVSASALRHCVHNFTIIRDAPIAVALRGVAGIALTGEISCAREILRAILCHLAVFHSPDDALIMAVLSDTTLAHWEWIKWFPHNAHPHIMGITGPASLIYTSMAQARKTLAIMQAGRELNNTMPSQYRHIIVMIDTASHDDMCISEQLCQAGVTVIMLNKDTNNIFSHNILPLNIVQGRIALSTSSGNEIFAHPDRLSLSQAQTCARRLARYCPESSTPALNPLQRWCSELAIDDPCRLALPYQWPDSQRHKQLRVPLGIDDYGHLVELDIKEAAEGGHGPHGVCVGATGSGKSELLRTIVLGMIARHRPDQLNLILVDFKGGATFLGFDGVQHISAIITNLNDETYLVARMKEALRGEIHRRQELFRQAGNAANLNRYHHIQQSRTDLPILPALCVVIDEFAELLQHYPDMTETIITLARVGRSLGIHLLLATQRLDEGRLRGLDSHLSYRLCLKTMTTAESRAAIGVSDAAQLPSTPGVALLRTSDGHLKRFQSIHVGAQYSELSIKDDQHFSASLPVVQQFSALASNLVHQEPSSESGLPFIDLVVAKLKFHGPQAHQIWLQPQIGSPQLSMVIGAVTKPLCAAIGIIDIPFEQRRAPLLVDFSGTAGHAVIVGAPQTGKSTTLRTIITALAAHHDARHIQFYMVDCSGGALVSLYSLPQVGSVAPSHNSDLVRQIMAHIRSVIHLRERIFAELAITDIAQYRNYCVDKGSDVGADIFLIIDGWNKFREEFSEYESFISTIATQGLSVGVHVMMTAHRWADLRPGLKDQLGTRLELRLGDPRDSEMDRHQAALIPLGEAGRGVTVQGKHYVIALPDLADTAFACDYHTPLVRVLPDVIAHQEILNQGIDDPTAIVIGLGESDLAPVQWDIKTHQHMLIVGDSECGKTNTLRILCQEIIRTTPLRPATVFLIDYRRTLVDFFDSDDQVSYALSQTELAHQFSFLREQLTDRLTPSSLTARQPPQRPSWMGTETFVVIDDYDLVASSSADTLSQLNDMVPYAKDIGLHIVVARRCAGAARAMFDPLLAQLRDVSCLGMLMDGNPEEGTLLGNHRAYPQRPGRGVLVTRKDSQIIQVGWCCL